MIKKDLVCAVSERTGLSQQDVEKTINAALNITKETVVSGEEVSIRGFGAIKCKTLRTKKARNVSTGEEIIIPEHNAPKFTASAVFKKEVSEGLITFKF